mgnify:CR=1 FL=1
MSYKSLLMNRNYRLLLLGQSFSAGGSALSSLGILWYAAVNVGSPSLAGLIGTAWGLPSVLSFVAGVVADQTDRRQLMIRVDGLSAILMLVLAIAIYFQHPSPSLILISFILLLSLLREFFETASFAFLPSLVDKEEITPANSLLNVTQQGLLALARVIGGGLLSVLGVVGLLLIDAISYFVSALTLIAIPHPQGHMAKERVISSVNVREAPFPQKKTGDIHARLYEQIADIKAGFLQMWTTPLIRKVVPWALPANAAYGAILVLLPSWISHKLNSDATLYGFMIGMGTGGFMIGAILAPFFAGRYQANWIMGYFTLLEAIALFFFTLVNEPILAILLYTSMSLFDGLSSPIFFSLLQVQTSEEYLGRIFGGLMTLLALGQPIGMFLGGILAEYGGLFTVFVAGSILIGLAGLRFLFAQPLRARLPSQTM